MKSPWPTIKLGDKEYFKILGSGIERFEGEKEYLSTSSIEGNKIIAPECKITYQKRPSRANMQPRLNSVWFARMINTIKVYSFTENNKDEIDKYILSTGFAGILCNPEKVDPRYLEKIFLSKWFNDLKDSLASDKAIQKSLNNDDIANLEIPLPPLPIQQKIVQILDTIQEAIDIHDKIIEKTKELKKSLMAELFKYGGPSFRKGRKLKQTEIGEIPEDWEVVRLGEVVLKFIGGGTPSTNVKEYWDGEIPWTTSSIIEEEKVCILKKGQKYISKLGLENSSTQIVPAFNLLIGTRVGVGKVAINEIDIAINQDLTGIIYNKEKINLFYFAYLLTSPRCQGFFNSYKRGATIKGIPRSDLETMLIPLPPLPEQQEIAEILQTVDKKIEIERRKKELYEELFKTVLNKIMNQEIDVESLDF